MKLSKLRVPELRKRLKALGLDEKGNRPVLIKRLREALLVEQNAKGSREKQADPQFKDDEQPATTGENPADSKTQQPAPDRNDSAEGRPSMERTYKRKLEDDIRPEDHSPKRRYKANTNGHTSSSATQVTRQISSPPRRQYRSKKVADESGVQDKQQVDRAPPVQEQPSTRSEPAKRGEADSPTSPQDGKNGVKNLDKESIGVSVTTGRPSENGSSTRIAKAAEPKSTGNLQDTEDAASLERIRRRKERFGIVIKEAAGGDPTDEEAVRRRRARFGTITVMSNSAKISKAAKQEHDEAALRRRAEKFGMNGVKRGPTDTALPKDEVEKRLKRQKRFQSVS